MFFLALFTASQFKKNVQGERNAVKYLFCLDVIYVIQKYDILQSIGNYWCCLSLSRMRKCESVFNPDKEKRTILHIVHFSKEYRSLPYLFGIQ